MLISFSPFNPPKLYLKNGMCTELLLKASVKGINRWSTKSSKVFCTSYHFSAKAQLLIESPAFKTGTH